MKHKWFMLGNPTPFYQPKRQKDKKTKRGLGGKEVELHTETSRRYLKYSTKLAQVQYDKSKRRSPPSPHSFIC